MGIAFGTLGLMLVLLPSQVLATAAALYGTSCAIQGANNTTGPDGTGNNFICDSGTITWRYPAYQLGTTALGCSSTGAGMLQWNGSAFQGCNGSTWSTFNLSGNSILGTTTTSANPQALGDPTTGLLSLTTSTVSIETAGVEALRITSTGSMGLGTTTPSDKLDVAGAIGLTTTSATLPTTGIYSPAAGQLALVTTGVAALSITSTGSVGLATTAPKASVDFSAKTDGLLLQTTSAAAGASCTSTLSGAIRWNSNITDVEYCTGSAWLPFRASGAPAGSGFFVMTKTLYSGNFGGLTGANASCLTDLTTNTNWWGYLQANGAGLLNSTHVKAFLCDGTTCNNANVSTTYYYGNSGDNSAGGGNFTTDASGLGPNDSISWASGNRLGGVTQFYWTGRNSNSATKWASTFFGTNCSGWTSTSGSTANEGNVVTTDGGRWHYSATAGCNQNLPLVCFVNP